jgi:uncharacterized RDD family membrane protein YckC
MLTKVDHTSFPRLPIWRRGVAFGIDFFCVWLLSNLLGGSLPGFQVAQVVVFFLAWLGMRVFLVYRNQGQSLGRYALDMKVIDTRLGSVPGLQALCHREAITGFGSLLVAIALANLATNVGAVLLMVPLAIDCGIALSEPERRQAFHDRLARTLIVPTYRGYSLDLKVKRLLAQVSRSMRR